MAFDDNYCAASYVAKDIAAAAVAAASDSAARLRLVAGVVSRSAAARHDFELLREAAAREGWADEIPVPSEFFGQL